MEHLISEEQCKRILANVDPYHTFESFEVKELEDESVNGFICDHYKLYIEYEDGDSNKNKLQYFLKTLNKTSMSMIKIYTYMRIFDKERLFLMVLLPMFKERGIDVSFAPRGYLCENDTIVMEDLSQTNFKLFPKTEDLDLEHCYSCLAVIAKFHVSSIMYENFRSQNSETEYSLLKEHPYLLKDFEYYCGENDKKAVHLEKTFEAFLLLAKLEFGENIEYIDFEDKLCAIFANEDRNLKFPKCLLHGDLWSNNFLHRYDGIKLEETKLVDFQLIKYGHPGSDVLHFIYTNTRKKFRDEYFDTFLLYYYNKLKKLLYDKNLLIEGILPKGEFFECCEDLKIFAKLHSTLDRCLTRLPDEIFYDVINCEENLEEFLFRDRGKILIVAYQNISQYRDIIGEDLRELREMVSASS